MRKTASALLGSLAFSALLLCGCGSEVHDGVNMKNCIGYGAVLPYSGTYHQVGAEIYRGMLTAQYSLNATGGFESKQVKVVIYDSAGEPEKGLDGVRRLTRDFNVPFMAVAMPGVVDRVATEYAEHNTVAARLEGASRDTEKQAENSLQAYINAEDEIRLITETAAKEQWKNVLTLAVEDRYGDAAGERLKNNLGKAGVTRSDLLPLRNDAGALETIRATAAATAYDAVCIFAHGPEVGPTLEKLKQAGFRGIIVGNHAFGGKSVTRLDATTLKNIRFTAPAFYSRPDRPMTARFNSEYHTYHRDTPDLFAAIGYDQLMMVFTAVKAEDYLDPTVVRDRIISDKTFEGAVGTYRFDENGCARLELTLEPVVARPKVGAPKAAPRPVARPTLP